MKMYWQKNEYYCDNNYFEKEIFFKLLGVVKFNILKKLKL